MAGLLIWPTDARVVHRVRHGRKHDFGILVNRHYGLAHSIAFAHTGSAVEAEDIAQESFLRAYSALDSLRDAARFRAWLAAIARNLSLARLREQRREAPLTEAAETAAQPDIDSREVHALLWQCIENLDDASREVVLLHYFEQMKIREIAVTLDATPAAVAKRLQRAREALGASMLQRLEGTKPDTRHARGRKATLTALGGTTAAWQAAAMTGGGAALGAWGLSAVGAAIVLTAAGAVYVSNSGEQSGSPEPQEATAASTTPKIPAAEFVAGETTEEESEAPSTLRTATGPCTVKVSALRLDSTPAANFTLRIERIDWGPADPVPPEPIAEEFTLDENGEAAIDGLAYGSYVAVATGEGQLDLGGFSFSKEHKQQNLRLQMLPAEPMRGRVILPDGSPAVGANVFVHLRQEEPTEPIDHDYAAALRQVTDSEGRFVSKYVWPGAYSFYAETREGLAGVSPMTPLSDEAVVQLDAPGILEGRVVFADSKAPAPAVSVVFKGSCLRDAREVTSDAEGNINVRSMRPGRYQIQTADAVMLLAEESLPPLEIASAVRSETEIPVKRGAVIMGRVFDQATGRGIGNVGLDIRADNSWQWVETNSDGSFFQGGFKAPANVILSNVRVASGLFQLPPDRLQQHYVLEDSGELELDIPLVAAPAIRGRVLNHHPDVEDKTTVTAMSPGSHSFAEVDNAGRFRIGAPVNRRIKLYAGNDKRVSAYIELENIPPEGLNDINLELIYERSVRVHGIVRSESGGLLDGMGTIEAQLTPKDTACPCERSQRLWGGRSFDIPHVVPGEYTLQLMAEQVGPIGDPIEVTVPADSPVAHLEIPLSETHARRLVGRVVNSRGQEIAGATISYMRDMGAITMQTTNRNGRFTLQAIAECGSCWMEAYHEEYATVRLQPVPEQVPLTIEMPDRRVLAGVVLDAETRAPLKDVRAEWADKSATSNATGEFRLAGLDSECTVAFKAAGYVTSYVSLSPELEQPSPLEVLMIPGNTFQGHAQNAEGLPMSGVSVYVNQEQNVEHVQRAAATDAEGNFTLPDLPSDSTLISLTYPGYGRVDERIYPHAETGVRTFTLQTAGNLQGWLKLNEPAQISAELKNARISRGLNVSPQDTTEGYIYPINETGLPEGRFDLMLTAWGLAGAERMEWHFEVNIAKGETTTFERLLTVPDAGLEITLLENGDPALGGYNVQFVSDQPEGATRQERADDGSGVYLLHGLEPGPGTLYVAGNHTLWQQPVRLQAGTMTQISVELGQRVEVTAPECQGCVTMLIRPETYDRMLSGNARVFGMHYRVGEQFQGIHVGSGETVRVQPGEYRLVRADMTDWAQEYPPLSMLEGAPLIRVEAGETALALP